MALKKCPKCELNYIRGDAPYCDVCMRSMRRGDAARVQQIAQEEEILCSECGEAPAVEGYELCADCLREQKRQKDFWTRMRTMLSMRTIWSRRTTSNRERADLFRREETPDADFCHRRPAPVLLRR